MTAGQVFGLAR